MSGRLTDNDKLMRARNQYFILRAAQDELREYVRGLRSHTDVPAPASPDSGAMAREVARRDMLKARVRAEQGRLDRYQQEARRIIGRMERRRALFAMQRYIYCEEMKAIKKALAGEVSASQIDRYKRQIESEGKGLA